VNSTNIFKPALPEKVTNPYVGPRAFQKGEQIFGRDREARQLVNLIVAERIVLLYSPSGAGKTSLIQAAVLPQLEKMKFRVLPNIRVNLATPEAGLAANGFNRYVNSAILSLEEGLPAEQRSKSEHLAGMNLADYLSAYPAADSGRGIDVLIFDQFEEILTLDPTDQANKQEFFRQLGQALEAPNRWALVAMREDYIAALDPFLLTIPNRFRTTFRLDLLGTEAARQAIQQPARNAGVQFEDAAAEKLVDDLRKVRVQRPDGSLEPQLGPYVEPVQLQVVCYRLWGLQRPDGNKITTEDLAAFGQVEQSLVDQSLAEYYDQRVLAAATQTGLKERAIREWVDRQLITELGVRGTVLMGPERSGGLENQAVWSLVNAHLVRAEKRGGATWFELAHDRLLAPIRADNAEWFKANLSILQTQASLWVQQGRPENLLPRGKNLVSAMHWADENKDELLAHEIEFLEAGRKLNARERRARLLNRLIAILGVAAIILAGIAFTASLNAQQQARIARAGQLAAQAQAGLELNPVRSLLLAMEANSANTDGEIRSAPAQEALRAALKEPHGWYLYGADDAVTVTAFSPDGTWLATGGEEGNARLYNMDTVEPGVTPEYWLEHDSPVRAMAFDPRGRWLATGYRDGSVRLWDLQAENPENAPLFLLGHSNTITSIEFGPDGRWLATGSLDGTARLWDLEADNPIVDPIVLTCPDGGVTTLAFSPGRERLATASSNIVRMWDLEADNPAEEPIALQAPFTLIQSMAFSPDGRWLATGSRDRAWLWDLGTDNEPANLIGLTEHFDAVSALAFSPDSEWLASGSGDGIVRLWALGNIEEDINPILLVGHEEWITKVVFSPDGHWLASGSGDHTVRLWDITAENPTSNVLVLRGHDDVINTLAFSPDVGWLVTGGEDQSARIWELVTLEEGANPIVRIGQDQGISVLHFSPDGNWLATGAENLRLYRWDAGSMNPVSDPRLMASQGIWISAMNVSSNGRWLATASSGLSDEVRLWDLGINIPTAEARTLGHFPDLINVLAFSPDGRWLASGSRDKTIRLWNLQTPDPDLDVKILEGHQGEVNALAFSPDGRWLASGSADNEARLWDLTTADPAVESPILQENEDDIFALAFSPDGRWLATASGDQTARLWEINTDGSTGESTTLYGHEDQVWSLAFSPNGRWLVTGSLDETARLWDMNSGNPAENSFVLRGHEQWVTALAISPNSRWLATGSSDRTIRLWDLEADDPTAHPVVLTGHEGQVNTLAFSPDSRWLASGGEDAALRLWLVEFKDLVQLACRSAGRNLTSYEWQQFFPEERYRKTCEEWTDTP